MFNKIFRSSFITSLFVIIISFCLVLAVLFDYFETQVFTELKSEASYISYALKNEGVSYIDNFENGSRRITLVSEDGTVLVDTAAKADELENHADRKEIKDAIQNGSGMSSRYSDTLMQKNLYYAEKLDDGTILRVSTAKNSVFITLLGLIQPFIIIAIIALIISFLLSRRVSKAIVKPLCVLDLENPAENETYDELTPLLKKCRHRRKSLTDR